MHLLLLSAPFVPALAACRALVCVPLQAGDRRVGGGGWVILLSPLLSFIIECGCMFTLFLAVAVALCSFFFPSFSSYVLFVSSLLSLVLITR